MAMFTNDEFDAIVERALDAIPERFTRELENIVFFVEDEVPDYLIEEGEDPEMLGLYDGVSLYERGETYGIPGDYPDSITVFKGPHERLSDDPEVVAEEVYKTIIHEVAHYFGMTEDQVTEMGYE